ncbi:NTP transferase domain-containing protein [Sphingomonas sp. NBWT7]|uniref:NTP transferase domain-containing protein n=1 Tax=Sphingomonas sp. NBWT7 TaxID=2596913 RepID=UPI00162ADBBE|nr:NTP transferase domain-containing protein [Sphingomonas sp. NBWT7]QNE32209.1 NTP transferase domain-containing protein [Sphingomonas sp. NBWT7]
MTLSALILAGSRGGVDPVAAYAGVPHKALIVLEGETLLARVAAALRGAGVQRVLASADAGAVADEADKLGLERLAPAAGPSASAAAGFAAGGAPMLVTTADHALLRPEWIAAFLDRAPRDADVSILLARREAVERDAPATKRTWLRFADGDWSGCNLFLLASPRAAAALALWQEVERDRKRPWRIVIRLGPGMLLRYLLRRLTLAEAVARIGARAGIKAAIVESPYGLAAVDVDKPADLDLVRTLVR